MSDNQSDWGKCGECEGELRTEYYQQRAGRAKNLQEISRELRNRRLEGTSLRARPYIQGGSVYIEFTYEDPAFQVDPTYVCHLSEIAGAGQQVYVEDFLLWLHGALLMKST